MSPDGLIVNVNAEKKTKDRERKDLTISYFLATLFIVTLHVQIIWFQAPIGCTLATKKNGVIERGKKKKKKYGELKFVKGNDGSYAGRFLPTRYYAG